MRVRKTNRPTTWREALRVFGRQLVSLILFIIGVVIVLGIIVFISE